jgi:Trk K+ transport system NAD-binding subunit
MDVLSIFTQLSGVVVIFIVADLLTRKIVKRELSDVRSSSIDAAISGHTIVCGHEKDGWAMTKEVEQLNEPVVVVTNNKDEAMELDTRNFPVVYDEYTTNALEQINVQEAKRVIVNIQDGRTPGFVLALKDKYDISVISVVNEQTYERSVRDAGSDQVISPRADTGVAIADKLNPVTLHSSAMDVGSELGIYELVLRKDSELVGEQIADIESAYFGETDILGVWNEGTLRVDPAPNDTIEQDSILVVSGRAGDMETAPYTTNNRQRLASRERVVIVGLGVSGSQVNQLLSQTGAKTTTIDTDPEQNADITGDATTKETIDEADLQSASALVVTVNSDIKALSVILLARSITSDIKIVSRVGDIDSVQDAYRGGANHVISTPQIAGRSIASEISGKKLYNTSTTTQIGEIDGSRFKGETVVSAAIRERTGCTAIAIRRNGELIRAVTNVRIRAGDDLIVAGSNDDVRELVS